MSAQDQPEKALGTRLSLVLEGDGCWPDLAQSGFVTGELQAIARLPAGTNRGNSSVGLRVKLPDGRIVIAETTMLLFLTAGEAFAMRESMAMAEALEKARAEAAGATKQ